MVSRRRKILSCGIGFPPERPASVKNGWSMPQGVNGHDFHLTGPSAIIIIVPAINALSTTVSIQGRHAGHTPRDASAGLPLPNDSGQPGTLHTSAPCTTTQARGPTQGEGLGCALGMCLLGVGRGQQEERKKQEQRSPGFLSSARLAAFIASPACPARYSVVLPGSPIPSTIVIIIKGADCIWPRVRHSEEMNDCRTHWFDEKKSRTERGSPTDNPHQSALSRP
jgi:hypothetical protein